MLTNLLAFIIVIGVLVFVHELGHFLVAKAAGIRVPRFSIGLGPRVLGFRRGETEYVISALPLGGYVKMAGLEELEAIEGGSSEAGSAGEPREHVDVQPGRTFDSKPVPTRALVISAGVIMNWVFAVAVFGFIALVWGIPQLPETRIATVDAAALPPGTEALSALPAGARITAIGDRKVDDWRELLYALAVAQPGPVTISFADAAGIVIDIPATEDERDVLLGALSPLPRIGHVAAGQPAEQAGLLPGDQVREAGGEPVASWEALVLAVEAHPEQPLTLGVLRDGQPLSVTVTPRATADADGRVVGRIGVSSTWRRDAGLGASLVYGATETWDFTLLVVGVVRDLIIGRVSPRQLGGPIMIGQVSGQTARAGLEAFLGFMAILSVNLAVLNLLPIPVLDGGQLLLLAVEGVRGRALSVKARMRLAYVGVVLVVLLILLAVYNDILRLFGL